MKQNTYETHIGDGGIVEDIGPVLTHPEVFTDNKNLFERHLALCAALGGTAIASIGLVASIYRQNAQVA